MKSAVLDGHPLKDVTLEPLDDFLVLEPLDSRVRQVEAENQHCLIARPNAECVHVFDVDGGAFER